MSTRVLVVDRDQPEPAAIEEAAAIIRRGGLVAFPTETVYGLGANALDEAAARRIFTAKDRPTDDPLIVHLAATSELARVAVTESAWIEPLAARFWPGPLTLVVPKRAAVPPIVTAGRDSVAVRVPAHSVALALIRASGCPIAAPSANMFARPSPTTAAHVLADLADRIDLVLDGGSTSVGVESTVLDLTGDRPAILRPGGVTAEQLADVLGQLAIGRPLQDDPRSPGTAQRHYSPRARVDLFDEAAPTVLMAAIVAHLDRLRAEGQRAALLLFDGDLAACPRPALAAASLGPVDRLATAASRLYAALRELDAAGPDAIVARLPPDRGLGAALRDRLRRAANGRVLPVASWR